MQQIEEELFASWCRRSDAKALGGLFDLTAPRLLKLAIHLVGDAAAAEDLVQATFLALIEQRGTIDASRPVMPWLSGVLSHKAQQLRRERAKPIDVDRLHRRAVAEPSARLEERELSGDLAEAIDKLGEPYRQVLLLRVRHGMELADIAHVLERDPGTVSVQLHRGVERLRQLLPALLTSSLLLGLFAPRGLAAVKASVLSEASAAAAVAGGASILGGVLVSKKIIAVACLALLAALFYSLRPQNRAAAPDLNADSSGAEVAAVPPRIAAPITLDARVPESGASSSVPSFTGSVIDAETGAPLPNATVALFAGRETTPFELQRDHPDYYKFWGAVVSSRTQGDWPRVVGADELAMAGRRPLVSLDRPEPGQKALARTTSDSQGKFTLPAMSQIGLIEVSLAGHVTRWRPLVDRKFPVSISLGREREISGEVIDESGARITEPLELLFFAYGEPSRDALERYAKDSAMLQITGDRNLDHEGIELQRVTTAKDGTFHGMAGARRLSPDVLSPGWTFCRNSRPCVEDAKVTLQLKRAPLLHFFDAESKQPVERVRLLARETANRSVMSCSDLYAPGGLAPCPLSEGEVMWSIGLEFTAWAAGHEPARWTSMDRSKGGVIEVPLRAGDLPVLQGKVLRDGKPVEHALVAVFGQSARMWQSAQATRNFIDAQETRDGTFQFELPSGKYLLRIRDSAGEAFTVVEDPMNLPLVIDLGHLGRIEVLVVDQAEAPRAHHVVGLQGGDSRSARGETDADGIAVFEALPAGQYTVMAPNVSTPGSFRADAVQKIELAVGEHSHVRLDTIASTGPRHARVALKDTQDFAGWRARFSGEDWVDLTADGTLPTELSTYASRVDVRAPDGRQWSAAIPTPAPDGTVIQLEYGTVLAEGEIVDEANRPIRGLLVIAKPRAQWSVGDVSQNTATDSAGRFSFAGLASETFTLTFEREGREMPLNFVPRAGAIAEHAWIRIQIATPGEEVRLTGTIRDRAGKLQAGARVVAAASIPQPDGVLCLLSDRSYTSADSGGQFEFKLPRTPILGLRVFAPEGWQVLAERELTDDGSPERTVDLTID